MKEIRLLGIWLYFTIFIVTSGCSTLQLPEVTVMPVSQYKFSQNQKDLAVAIDPFFEEDRLKKYFGTNLLSYGILPVFITIENNTNQPLLIQREDISLFSTGDKIIVQLSPPLAREPFQTEILRKDVTFEYGIIGVMLFTPFKYPASPFAESYADLSEIIQNISKKALIDKSIYQGETHNGFIYFKLEKTDTNKNISKLQIMIKNLATEDKTTFIFYIK